MSCWNCEDGLVMVCPDDICRGLGHCQLVNPCKNGLRVCQVCDGSEEDDYTCYECGEEEGYCTCHLEDDEDDTLPIDENRPETQG